MAGLGLEVPALARPGEDMAALAHRHQLVRRAEAAVQQRVGTERFGHGTTIGTTTDSDGAFYLSSSAKSRRLQVSYLGYADKYIPVVPGRKKPMSAVASEGAVSDVTVPFAPEAALPPASLPPEGIRSVFFKAPRKSASRRLSPGGSFASFTGITVRSGLRPLP